MTGHALDLEQAMKIAVARHEAGRWRDAESQYRAILQAHPNHAGANHNLGLLLAGLGKPQLGLPHLRAALEADPGQARHWFSLVDALLATGQPGAAASFLDRGRKRGLSGPGVDLLSAKVNQALKPKADDFDAHFRRGNELAQAGRFEEAIVSYGRALRFQPGRAGAHNNLGAALFRLGRLDEAAASYRRALELKPDFADAHNNLGDVLTGLKQSGDAAENYRQALRLKPDYLDAHFKLGNALTSLGRFEEAISHYRLALELAPDHADVHNNLGFVLLRLSRFEEAVASCGRALELRPDAYTHHNLGEALKGAGKLKEAAQHFRQGLGIDSKSKALECLYEIGDRAKYRDLLEEVSRSEPDSIRIAAIASFVSSQWGCENPYNFCKNPIDFIRTQNIGSEIEDSSAFLDRLAQDLSSLDAVWEPTGKSTINGFQTADRLFDLERPSLNRAERLIRRLMLEYKAAYLPESCGMIGRWPEKFSINGWCVRLPKGGFQEAHIHPGGWLSGVFYIEMPRKITGDEGAIAFSLRGLTYRVVNENIPKFVFRPQAGDIVIFPSSLYHTTIPFNSDEERICISFDLVPAGSGSRYRDYPADAETGVIFAG